MSVPHVFAIPPSIPFLPTLAEHLKSIEGEALVLLPTRRACRTLQSLVSNKKHRILPIGEAVEEGDHWLIEAADDAEILPAISPGRRLLLLTKLVQQHPVVQKLVGSFSLEQAASLAESLCALIDDLQRHAVDPERLRSLAPEDFSEHWKLTLDFLEIILTDWPNLLRAEGKIDPIARRNLLLAQLSRQWAHTPPPYPILAAGSTASLPTTADLLTTIAQLPQGQVILPGLDRGIPTEHWQQLTPTHPHFYLKALLDRLKLTPSEIRTLGSEENSARSAILTQLFAPGPCTPQWSKQTVALDLKNWELMESRHELEEAHAIAVRLRALKPGTQAALITQDRELAQRVRILLEGAIDDSAGTLFSHTPTGYFLRLILDVAMSRVAPLKMLEMLDHPLCMLKPEASARLAFERDCLRGLRKAQGWQEWIHCAQQLPEIQPWLHSMAEAFAPLEQMLRRGEGNLQAWLDAHLATADACAGGLLWQPPWGKEIESWWKHLREDAAALGRVEASAYPGLVSALLRRLKLYPEEQAATIHLLSPMEARLHDYNLVILAGFNEDSWPPQQAGHSWLNRAMCEVLGMPTPEHAIGQAAHDVLCLSAQPHVIWSRAKRVDGTETQPSRWWRRLLALAMSQDQPILPTQGIIPVPSQPPAPITRPAPVPPNSAKPDYLRATDIDTLMRNPYAFYVRRILDLTPLKALDEEPTVAEFGSMAHKVCETYIRTYPRSWEECVTEVLNKQPWPEVTRLWWQARLMTIAPWWQAQDAARRLLAERIEPEVKCSLQFGPVKLASRIDRVEHLHDQTLAVIDYKTGTVPPKKHMELGMSSQLAIEALLATHTYPTRVSHAALWKLAGREGSHETREFSEAESLKLASEAREGIQALIDALWAEDAVWLATPDPDWPLDYDDSKDLAREAEWA